MKALSICLVILTISFATGWSQESLDRLTDEEILKLAREEATLELFESAQLRLTFLLERNPAHLDARVFLSRIFAWNAHYDSARSNLEKVLFVNPYHEDALRAMIDVALWSQDFDHAVKVANRALTTYSDDPEFLYKKAKALYSLKRLDEANLAVRSLVRSYPQHSQGRLLMKQMSHEGKRYLVGTSYGIDVFNKVLAPAHNASIFLNKKNAWGSALVSTNFASRFGVQDLQGEVELYPRIYRGVYGYLNYGYSGGDLYPIHRVGAELFFPVAGSLETSAGMRYMHFKGNSGTEILTASIGWYSVAYSVLARLFVTPDAAKGTGISSFLVIKKLWSSPDEYVGLNASIGFSPDVGSIQTSMGLASESIYNLRSQSIGVESSKLFNHGLILVINMNVTRQQYLFDASAYVTVGRIEVGVKKRL